jgi:hypothetical protein
MSMVAAGLFECEDFSRPVMCEQDHLHVAIHLHPGRRGAQVENSHRGVLIDAKDLR